MSTRHLLLFETKNKKLTRSKVIFIRPQYFVVYRRERSGGGGSHCIYTIIYINLEFGLKISYPCNFCLVRMNVFIGCGCELIPLCDENTYHI